MLECESVDAKFRFYSVSDLFRLSEPEWLVEKLFPVESLIGLYGPSGHGKSFLALAWALSIADGGDWLGRPVQQGHVVYIAAEGGRSIRKRVSAWMLERGRADIPGAFFLLEGIQAKNGEDISVLCDQIEARSLTPRLIVLDTLARCFVGGDENSAQEMGEFIAGLDRLKQRTGAAILVLHHTGKKAQEVERGSTALRAALDVMIRVSMKGELVTIHNDKQKDDEEFADIDLHMKQVAVDGDTSCVLEPGGVRRKAGNPLSVGVRNLLGALVASGLEVITSRDWKQCAALDERTFYSYANKLTEGGYVEKVKRGAYTITEKGRSTAGTAATATHLQFPVN